MSRLVLDSRLQGFHFFGFCVGFFWFAEVVHAGVLTTYYTLYGIIIVVWYIMIINNSNKRVVIVCMIYRGYD